MVRLRGVDMGFAVSEKERIAESDGGKKKRLPGDARPNAISGWGKPRQTKESDAGSNHPNHPVDGERNVIGSPFLLLTV